MESVTLKALQFYRKDVQKRYDKIDAIVNGKHGARLAEVYQQTNELMQAGIKTATDQKKLKELADKEKRLMADLKRSCDSKNTDKWCALKIELEEIDREIALGLLPKEDRSARIEVINKQMVKRVADVKCGKCNGELKQTRSGAKRAKCQSCGGLWQLLK